MPPDAASSCLRLASASALKNGIRSQQVLDAYEYYYGVPYDDGEANKNAPPSYTPPYTPPKNDYVTPDQMGTAATELLKNLQNNYWMRNGVLSDRGIENIRSALERGIITEKEGMTILDMLGVK